MAVQASLTPSQLIERAEGLIKIADPEQVSLSSSVGLSGISLKHVEAPHAEITREAGFEYFELDLASAEWKAVVHGGTIAAYVPASLEEPRLRLVLLLEEGKGRSGLARPSP